MTFSLLSPVYRHEPRKFQPEPSKVTGIAGCWLRDRKQPFPKPAILPASVKFATTFNAPTVFFPDHKNVVLVTWRGPANHVRYSVGIPKGRNFSWNQSDVVPGNPPSPTSAHCMNAPCTSATPAVTEQTTGTSSGLIYVFWKQLGTKDIFYSTTTDNHATD